MDGCNGSEGVESSGRYVYSCDDAVNPVVFLSGPLPIQQAGDAGGTLPRLSVFAFASLALIMLSSASFGKFAPRTRHRRLENETHSDGGWRAPQEAILLPTIWRLEIPYRGPSMNAIRHRKPKNAPYFLPIGFPSPPPNIISFDPTDAQFGAFPQRTHCRARRPLGGRRRRMQRRRRRSLHP